MERFLIVIILIINTSIFSQVTTTPVGPNDFNQASYYRADDTVIKFDKKDTPYIAFKNGHDFKPVVQKYNGVSWEKVGEIDSSLSKDGIVINSIDIAFDSNDTPFIVYTDASSDKAKVKKFNGKEWISVGSEFLNGTTMYYPKIEIDKNNNIYILYLTRDTNSRLTIVQKFDGIKWELVGDTGYVAGISEKADICLDKNNILYVAYIDTNLNKKVSVKKFNGNAWELVGVNGISEMLTSIVNITIDNNNIPYVMFDSNLDNGKIKVLRFDGAEWITVGNSFATEGDVVECKIAIDSNNILYIIGSDYNNPKIIIRKFNGSEWVNVGDPNFFNLYLNSPSIAFNSNNIPYAVYCDILNCYKAGVKKFNNSVWEQVGEFGISGGSLDTNGISIPQIVLNKSDIPYVIYSKAYNNLSQVFIKKFIGNSWESVGNLENNFEPQIRGNLSIDLDGVPYVIYQNNSLNKLVIKKFRDNNWELVGNQDGISTQNEYGKIYFDKNNKLYLATYENLLAEFFEFDGNKWKPVGNPIYSIYNINNFIFDKDNVPYIVTTEYILNKGYIPFVKKFNGSSWETIGINNLSEENINDVTITVDKNNVIYVAYISKDKIFLKKMIGSNWELVNVKDLPLYSDHSSIKLDVDKNNELILYFSDNLSFNFYKYYNNLWNLINFDKSFPNQLWYIPSIEIASDNSLFIAYKNCDGYVKKMIINSANDPVDPVDPVDPKDEVIIIYPNPVKENLNIRGIKNILEIEIYDLIGKRVLHLEKVNNEINIKILPNGIYVAKIKTEKGISLTKLIKE